MESLSVILGSGFSKPAGLPLARDIDDYFNRDNRDNLLKYPSDEWKWKDGKTGPDLNNGLLREDRIVYGYVLNDLLFDYKKLSPDFQSYEGYYQFIIDQIIGHKKLPDILKMAKKMYIDDCKSISQNPSYEIIRLFSQPMNSLVLSSINHLVADLLITDINDDEFKNIYKQFIIFISSFENTDIFTLNHDILLENLLCDLSKIRFSDGFSVENSELVNDTNQPIPIYREEFKEKINVFKLHGSIDIYKFLKAEENGMVIGIPYGCIYFKTQDYYEKQSPKRINRENGEIIQKYHRNISPQFITGTKKDELIESDYMYRDLYQHFEEKILQNSVLLIIGYSFGDEHINKQINNALKFGNLKKIININRSKDFPFEVKNGTELLNLRNLQELEEVEVEKI